METDSPGTMAADRAQTDGRGASEALTVYSLLSEGSKLMRQGAEARVFALDFMGRKALMKERFAKGYRHPELDRKLRIKRTLAEVRAIKKCRKLGLDAPVLYHVDYQSTSIIMEHIDGDTVRDILMDLEKKRSSTTSADTDEGAIALMQAIGKSVATLHNGGMIHGDLTTSNFLVRRDSKKLVMIDFGLTYVSHDVEDLAVDLYVLERAFTSTHPRSETLFKKV